MIAPILIKEYQGMFKEEYIGALLIYHQIQMGINMFSIYGNTKIIYNLFIYVYIYRYYVKYIF